MGLNRKQEKEFIEHIKNMRAIRTHYIEKVTKGEEDAHTNFVALASAEIMRLENSMGAVAGFGDLPPDESRVRIFGLQNYMSERFEKMSATVKQDGPPQESNEEGEVGLEAHLPRGGVYL